MKARDNKGRFTKSTDENYIQLSIPSLKSVVIVTLALVILLPRLIILSKFHPIKKIGIVFVKINGIHAEPEESEVPKKNGLFY